jgi:alpha-ketoglutarate-dependent taurine dioxygenase
MRGLEEGQATIAPSTSGWAAAAATLRGIGFVRVVGAREDELVAFLEEMGRIYWETDVTVKPGSRGMVTSSAAMTLHTDHSRADIVAWYCHEQTDLGGETLVVDARRVLPELTPHDLEELSTIAVEELRTLPDDGESHPLLAYDSGRPRLYFADWLVRRPLRPSQEQALRSFIDALQRVPPLHVRLRPGEALLVANRRTLHGRTEIRGSQRRCLHRFWVSCRPECSVD